MNEAKSQHPRSGYSLRERGACSFLGLFYITLHLFTISHWHAQPPWGGGAWESQQTCHRGGNTENFASFT